MSENPKAALRAATIVVGLALLATACRTDREVTTPKPVPVTQKRLAAALLTIDDLPSTFEAADEATPIDTDVVPEHECDDAISELDPKETASADFTGGGSVLSSTVAWFPGGGGAVDQLLRDIAADCDQVVVVEDGLSIRIDPLNFGVLSDDTLALKIELEQDATPIEERDVILMREGDLVSLVRLSGPRPSDKQLLDSVVRKAIGRLGGLADATT